jgi:hypothetical protein
MPKPTAASLAPNTSNVLPSADGPEPRAETDLNTSHAPSTSRCPGSEEASERASETGRCSEGKFVKNSTNSMNSMPATHRRTGGFAPGHPWRFQPGKSGNPKGRPPRSNPNPISDVLRERLAQALPDSRGRTYAEIIADKIIESAVFGSTRSINLLLDRVEGRPAQPAGTSAADSPGSQDWKGLIAVICAALEPFPEAQAAVTRAIEEYKSDGDDPD